MELEVGGLGGNFDPEEQLVLGLPKMASTKAASSSLTPAKIRDSLMMSGAKLGTKPVTSTKVWYKVWYNIWYKVCYKFWYKVLYKS